MLPFAEPVPERQRRDLPRIEPAEVLPDYLVCPVALDALGSRIPADDVAVDIELENGVVDGRFDQAAVVLLPFKQPLVRQLSFGQISGNVDEADEIPRFIMHRIEDGERPEPGAILAILRSRTCPLWRQPQERAAAGHWLGPRP